MDKRQAIAQIAELTKQAQELLTQARRLAEESDLSPAERAERDWYDSGCTESYDSTWMGSSC